MPRSWQKEPLAVTKEAQGVKGAKNEASIYDNNLLVLSLQLFHSHYPLTHLLFYIYFAFSLSASLSQSCFPFSLFCLACISLSCHKSTPLEAPKGSFPMASLCELCVFFFFLICSVPHYIAIDLIDHHEFYCLSNNSTIILNSIVAELDTQLWITLHFSPLLECT